MAKIEQRRAAFRPRPCGDNVPVLASVIDRIW
jgi:hypothetical protein